MAKKSILIELTHVQYFVKKKKVAKVSDLFDPAPS